MKKILYTTACLTLLATSALTISAWAMPGMEGKAPGKASQGMNNATEKFTKMDSNGDKSVNAEEFKAAYPQMTDAVFGIIDKDSKDGISLEEWMTFQSDHMQGMKEEQATPKSKPNLIITPPKKD